MPNEQSPVRDNAPAEGAPTEGSATAADPSGYVWDPRGYYWHPVARHWYEPYSRVYYSEDGQVLPAERAQADLAQAMGWEVPPSTADDGATQPTEEAVAQAEDAGAPLAVEAEEAELPHAAQPEEVGTPLATQAEHVELPAAAEETEPFAAPEPLVDADAGAEAELEPLAIEPPLGGNASLEVTSPGEEVPTDFDAPDLGGGDSFLDGPTVVGGLAYEESAIQQSLGSEEDGDDEPTEIPIDFGPEFSAVEHPLDLGAVMEGVREEAAAPSAPPANEADEAPADLPASIEPIEFAPEPSMIEADLDFGKTISPLAAEEAGDAPVQPGAPLDFGLEAEAPLELDVDMGAPQDAPSAAPASPGFDLDLGAPLELGSEPSGATQPPALDLDDLPAIDLGAPGLGAPELSTVDADLGPALELSDGAPFDFSADKGAPADLGGLGSLEESALGLPPPLREEEMELPALAAPPVAEPPAFPPAAEPPAIPQAAQPPAMPPVAELPSMPPVAEPPGIPQVAQPPAMPSIPTPPPVPPAEKTLLAPVPRASAPATPPPAAAAPAPIDPPPLGGPLRVFEQERAIVHLADGQVRRGLLQPGDLLEPLKLQTSEGLQTFEPQRVQILFLLRKPGEPPARPEGRLVQVFLPRGRSLTGYTSEDASVEKGLFLRPRTAEGSTSRVFVYPWAIQRMEQVG